MKTTHCLAADISQLGQLPIQHSDIPGSKRKRLEESMYWSCFKSESEFRVELPLVSIHMGNTLPGVRNIFLVNLFRDNLNDF